MKYILKGHDVVEADLMEWARFFEKGDRTVAKYASPSGDVKVSTVFVGLEGDMFETMVFGGSLDREEERYETWAQAEAGHERWVQRVKNLEKKV